MSNQPNQDELLKELESMKYDEWLPAESKLVKVCLGLGITLIVILVFISRTFFQ
jgi:hypothetical protein